MLLASLRCLYTRNKGQPLFQADSQDTCNNNVIDTKILVLYDNFIFQHPICFFRCHNISFQLLLSIYHWKVVIGGVTFHLCSPLEEDTFFLPCQILSRFLGYFFCHIGTFFIFWTALWLSNPLAISILLLKSGHSLNHQRTCCKNFAALYTRFFWLCDITWIFSWFLTVGIKITLLHHWLVKWPHSGWVNTVVWRRRRDTCQYSKQIVSTDVHTLLYYILWRLVDHISWNCLYFRISIHIVLVETQHTQATAQVTLSFTTLHFFESVEHSQTAPTHFLFLK